MPHLTKSYRLSSGANTGLGICLMFFRINRDLTQTKLLSLKMTDILILCDKVLIMDKKDLLMKTKFI